MIQLNRTSASIARISSGQLRFTDPPIEGGAQLRYLRILLLGGERREV